MFDLNKRLTHKFKQRFFCSSSKEAFVITAVCVCVQWSYRSLEKHKGSKAKLPHNSIQTMGQLYIKMWTLHNCDDGIVGSYFTKGLGSLLRTSPRYWGVMKRGWQERCILPPCPTIFWFYLFTLSNTLNPCYSGGREVHSMKIDTLAH